MAAAKMTVVGDYRSGNLRKEAQADLNFLDRQAKGFSSSITKSFGGIGAALGGMFAAGAVVDFFKQSAQAAMEDEKSLVALARAMDNVGLSAQNAQAEGLIESMMLQTGIADDQLRPAYQKLVTVTKDVTEAQGLLQTALDLSAAGYGDLESASKALSAAANGNFTALQRLKVPIDQAALSSKDFDAAVASLNKTVGGQAAAAAQTFSGQMNRLTVAVGEAQEAVGYALLNGFDKMIVKLGGTGGVQQAIIDAGNVLADFVTGVMSSTSQVGNLVTQLIRLSSFGLIPAGKQVTALDLVMTTLKSTLANLVGPLVTIMMYLEELGVINSDTAGETRGMTSATVQAAVAAGKASGAIAGLGDETEIAGNKAWDGTQSYLAFAESVVLARRATRDFGNTSATVQAAIMQGAQTGGVADFWDNLRQKYGEAAKAASSAGSSGSKAADDLAVKWRAAAASVGADIEILKVSFGGGGTVIAAGMVDAFQSRLDAFKSIVDTQVGIIKQGRDALDSYAKAVTDTVMGNIKFSMTNDKGEPLTPEQIVQMVLGDITNQQNAVSAIAKIATLIPPALTQQMLSLPPDAAIALANYLAANPAQVAQLTTNYQALATMTETLLGVPMALAFAKVGNESATEMIKNAKQKIDDEKESFASWVKSKLNTRITVTVDYVYNVGSPPSIPGRAVGGPVSAGSPYVVGERGPELFIPDVSGTIIPNNEMATGSSLGGGNNYSITVNAGVGDPRAIGRTVVEAITSFERSSGPVFARA